MSSATLNQRVRDRAVETGGTKRALLYLRVSTPSQVNTDYNPEGISIPAQREAGIRKAAELGAAVEGEYIEPGRTATSIEKRPVFQEMVARIKAQPDIDYIIVYHFSRIFRNSIDAAITKRELSRYGVRVVSTVLDMGDSPESAMVETIIHAVDQYQSEANGADIRYKMGQKAKLGGTITKAPLGYLNEHIDIEGRKVAVAVKDEQRAPHLLRGFELFGTGQYAAKEVLEMITAAGLVTRGNKSSAPKPVSLSQFYMILNDRYYMGVIEYDGEEYAGRHEALVSPELFDRVQRVLALRGGGGTRQRTHNHFLKGLLWCGRCGRRMIIMRGKGQGGTYFYFICRGRQSHSCTQPYLRVEAVEAAVERHYVTVTLSEGFRDRVRGELDEALLSSLGSLAALKKRLSGRLSELDAKEDQYLELVGTPGWPKDKLRRKLDGIQAERAEIAAQLADTSSRLETGRAFFLGALELLRDPQAFYRQGGTSLKRAMNRVIFTKLYVDGEDVTRDELGEAVRDVLEAQRQGWRGPGHPPSQAAEAPDASSPAGEGGAAWSDLTGADLLGLSLAGQGSSRTALVELRGFEPLTPSMRTRCATGLRYSPSETRGLRVAGRPEGPARRYPLTAWRCSTGGTMPSISAKDGSSSSSSTRESAAARRSPGWWAGDFSTYVGTGTGVGCQLPSAAGAAADPASSIDSERDTEPARVASRRAARDVRFGRTRCGG
jgi:site-specific DNA recombinase